MEVPIQGHINALKARIQAVRDRVNGIKRLPIKSDVDWELIDEMNQYLNEMQDELKELEKLNS